MLTVSNTQRSIELLYHEHRVFEKITEGDTWATRAPHFPTQTVNSNSNQFAKNKYQAYPKKIFEILRPLKKNSDSVPWPYEGALKCIEMTPPQKKKNSPTMLWP